jgi:hypothetical protein
MNRRRHRFPSRALRAVAALTLALVTARAETRPSANPADHWSFQPLRRPATPAGQHPVDAFVHAALRTNGLAPFPPATPRELIRRVYFDLTGLPPTPTDVAAFERECAEEENLENRKTGKQVDGTVLPSSGFPAFQIQSAGSAYARLVDRLLASPHYGERWARHWLDVVRFTESQGFEYDRPRDHAWPYRDYVIRAFNTDKPYDRFLREQVAGDVLEPVTADGIVAASLLVCGPWDQAGNAQANATQRAITREEELEDLIGVVGQTFLGLTVNCARCHDHKFDPISLTDYYRVKAVFDGVKHGDRSVEGAAEAQARISRREAAQRALAAAQSEVARIEADGARRAAAAKPPLRSNEPGPVPMLRWSFAATEPAAVSGELHGGATRADGRLQLPAAGAYFQSPTLPHDVREKTLEAWVTLADLAQGGGAAISLEAAGGTPFDAIVFAERQPRKWMAGSEGFARTRDLEVPEETASPGELVHLAAVYSADNRVALYRNGEPYGQPYAAGPLPTFRAGDARITLGRRHLGGGKPWLTGTIRQAALYDRALDAAEIAASFRAGGFVISTAEILAQLNPDQRAAREQALAQMERARKEIAAAEKSGPLAYAGKREQPAPTKVLLRGDVKKPGDIVAPGALTQLAAVPGDFGLAPDAPEAERRRRFADWLADPRNPLPARVMVNRVWQFHFGQGLVTTPSDFGLSGARPSHPELLDWLASEFIASGWSVKALHRLILTSATYRQASGERVISGSVISNQSGRRNASGSLNTDTLNTDYFREASAKDADNTLLWRFTPRRLEAEAVRDAMLAVSGQLNPQFGGPSFRPFTTSEYGATFFHLFDKGEPEFNRRTVYRMNINSGKEPLLDAFDCPDPSVKTPRRGVTTTPLQALSVMNGSFVQRQAGELAKRALQSADGDLPRAVNAAYELALSRPATAAEQSRAEAAARERGLASVCWALLNSTEFVYVR